MFKKYQDLPDRIAILWVSTSSLKTTSLRSPAREKFNDSFPSRSFVAQQFTGKEGKYVKIADTIKGFREIVDGKHNDLQEGRRST